MLHQLRQDDGDLYEHVLSTIMHNNQAAKGELSFEAASIVAKTKPLQLRSDFVGRPLPRHRDQQTQQERWVTSMANLIKAPDCEMPLPPKVRLQHIVEDFSLLEWANVGFDSQTVFQLGLSIKTFAESLPEEAGHIRFWGRVSTRSLPYFILESVSTDEIDGSEALEGRDGCNRLRYWVSQDIEAGTWIQLPHVTCSQIVGSRKFRRVLTGNLKAPVPSYPPFPGCEENFLRALITCISGGTRIAPDGMYEVQEESDPPVLMAVDLEEDKQASDLMDPGAWRMIEREPNEIGRITPLPTRDDDEEVNENGDVELPQLLAELKPEGWVFRVTPGGAGSAASSVVLARSLEWPGATAVARGRKSVCIYIGDGIRRSDTRHDPSIPGQIQHEWEPEEESQPLTEQDDPLNDPKSAEPIADTQNEDNEEDADNENDDQ